MDCEDPLQGAGDFLAAYHGVFPLLPEELAVVFDLVKLRLAMSLAISFWRGGETPDNQYLKISQAPAIALLGRLSAINAAFAACALRAACGLEAVPGGAAVAAWLDREGRGAAPLIGRDLDFAPKATLSMAAGAPGVELAEDPAAYSRFLDDFLAAEGAEVALGGYLEERAVYLGPVFDTPPGVERRTVHLGLDIFAPAGTAVHAPLAGRVVSVADNDRPLDYGPTVILEHAAGAAGRFYTLYGHLGRDCLGRLKAGDRVDKGQRIASFGGPGENGGWAPHLHFQIMTDLLGLSGDFPGVGEKSRLAVWQDICLDPNLLLGLAPEAFDRRGDDRADMLDARRGQLAPNLSLSYREPLKIVRGRGTRLYDQRGRAYLDCVNNISHVGHCHPRVVAALADQAALLNTNTRYLHDGILAYARRLTALLPAPLEVCFLVCSGSEANELAVRLARTYTGRRGALVLDGTYHGNTATLVDLSPYKCEGPGGGGLADWAVKSSMPDPYRGPYRGMTAETAEAYAAGLDPAIAELAARGHPPAFFIAESMLGVGGQIELPPGFLAACYQRARAAGALCIADEVQVGFGRPGSHMWAFVDYRLRNRSV